MQPSRPPIGMTKAQLASILEGASCRVFGHEQNVNAGHRLVVGELARQFDHSMATLLSEPSMTTSSLHPPDVVLVDPLAGMHVIEVKGVTIDSIRDIKPGGTLEIQYATGVTKKNVVEQVRRAMFAILSAYQQQYLDVPTVGFHYWVVFPFISKREWRWTWRPPEILLQDDLAQMSAIMKKAAQVRLDKFHLPEWPSEELARIRGLFGDNAVLSRRQRTERPKPTEGTLGSYFDERAAEYRNLSAEQQDLVEEVWEEGPRLVRGVAGSGKTVVLAANLARRIQRAAPRFLDAGGIPVSTARIAVLCFNRALPPLIKEKLEAVYRQREESGLPSDVVLFNAHINKLYWDLSRVSKGPSPWHYQAVTGSTDEQRADYYLKAWQEFESEHPRAAEELRFDTIYVDEGQDLCPSEVSLLARLCKGTKDGGEPNLIIFYDDAQNLYGRTRPTWSKHGINVKGRARIMKQCHRNPQPIIEPAFNVLYGSHADTKAIVPAKEFGDIAGLEEMKLIEKSAGAWRLHFARPGDRLPRLTFAASAEEEAQRVAERLRWLITEQEVRPQDVLVLSYDWKMLDAVRKVLGDNGLPGCRGIHVVSDHKDERLAPEGFVTFSTVHSAKGYDAYAVLMIGADTYANDVEHRAAFYVGCTRAMEYLEVFASSRTGLAIEMERAVESYRVRVLSS